MCDALVGDASKERLCYTAASEKELSRASYACVQFFHVSYTFLFCALVVSRINIDYGLLNGLLNGVLFIDLKKAFDSIAN